MPLFYSENVFVFFVSEERNFSWMKKWVQTIGNENVGPMQNIILQDYARRQNDMIAKGRIAVNLRSMTAVSEEPPCDTKST